MAKKLEQLMAELPQARRTAIEARAGELATLKDLRQVAEPPTIPVVRKAQAQRVEVNGAV
ncbi:hypothetical protein [Rhodoferax sp.]|uniref:hypothetical protein n=1 Tax=Rhodoferax sp. TaxID=50421 RepID=UPI002849397A|nr:hypothetical protein [Rhodoferax sp.]MDR3369381.1 hypothetical protein [Rhodoferax sp.]